ncbi:aminotransferase class V-fold PLP-dependent enzyme [Nordella sp. HKS 07]|uniref:aminotransferase class V-fold PLP-dependent enzyme n=1 Tax=Nordella sp. HKS 07 TaxID=2712222 RepID=UPI0013E19C5A|nr:aminotransferase class V-fold PLP-dependent enzyme [Nordella sp. HKS 07]QIG48561.1 aminotransferase class V-fold PLP-dependent enzyme [Nordella sp. HKS 07]
MPGVRGLFIPGPTNIPDAVRRALDIPMEDQRAPDLPDFTLPLFEDVKKVFKSRTGQAFLFPSSGTGGWEAALTNTLSPGDKILAARFGQFSHLWIDMCIRLGFEVDVVDAPWGEGVPVDIFAQRLKADRGHKIKAVLVTHNETATGVTSDVAGVRKALDEAEHPALLFVDGVSSIASIDFRMEEWRVDVAVSGSQKGFMLPAGLAILCVSQKALAQARNAQSRRFYFDFADMGRANKDGYFPYTPPTHMLRGLRASLDLLFAEGLEHVFARHHRLAEGVRKAVAAWGLKLCAAEPRWQSDTVSAIHLPDGFDSNVFVRHAYQAYGLSLGVGLSKVAGRVFRIGHLGDLNELMVLTALSGVELTLRDQGVPFTVGSGVAAAIEHFHHTQPAQLAKAA